MTLTHDHATREDHVVDFEEGRRVAWRRWPSRADPGARPLTQASSKSSASLNTNTRTA
jgi:hypothetical protein